jgi:cation transport ATPase
LKNKIATLAAQSTHPMSKAIVAYLNSKSNMPLEDFFGDNRPWR